MDEVIILETKFGVLLTHFIRDEPHYLTLTHFSDEMRPGDIYKGRVHRREGSRFWIDIGSAKAALLPQESSFLNVGENITVYVDRVPSDEKGAKVHLCQGKQVDLSHPLGKIQSGFEEWLVYLKTIAEPLSVITNSDRIFHLIKNHTPHHKITLKTDFYLDKSFYFAWQKILEPRFEIEEGGWLLFEEMETLTAIDVNTGGGLFSSQDFITDSHWLRFNKKCAKIILNELRLRQIGGLIIIDFPRLKEKEHQKILYQTLKSHTDSNTQILGFTRAGLFELTRIKQQDSLSQRLKREPSWTSFIHSN